MSYLSLSPVKSMLCLINHKDLILAKNFMEQTVIFLEDVVMLILIADLMIS